MYYLLYASTSLGLSITLLRGDSGLVIPRWCNQVSVCVSGALTLQSLLGYWLVRRGHPWGMQCYYYSLLVSCLVLMLVAANYIVFFFLSYDIIDQEWPIIQSSLLAKNNTPISKLNFKLVINSFLKMAGLYGVVFILLLMLTIFMTNRQMARIKMRLLLS